MNDVLQIELFTYENLVYGKILFQAEELRNGKGNQEDRDIFVHDGVHISSCLYPEIRSTTLFIHGSNVDKDNTAIKFCCPSAKDAIEYKDKLLEAVNQLNIRKGRR